jgi:hypothetical protein
MTNSTKLRITFIVIINLLFVMSIFDCISIFNQIRYTVFCLIFYTFIKLKYNV